MQKYSTRDFERDFPTDDACLEWLFKHRWPNGVYCEKCQRKTGHYRIKSRPAYSCEFCANHVYPMAATIFEGTRFSHLKLWFKAVAYMAVTRCGIFSRQLSRDLGVTVKTGYSMFMQIRKVLADGPGIQFLGQVEVDETYIGGKRPGKRGRGAKGKVVVMGIVERGGRAKAVVVPNVKAKKLIPVVEANVQANATVYTDDLLSYAKLARLGFSHKTIAHSQKVYVAGGDIHTNRVEGFWSQLKRSIDGTYHHVTARHLQRYIDEYAFRYSHRNDNTAMFKTMLDHVVQHASV